MNTDGNDKQWDSKMERRKSKRQRRRLVDLTLARGTDKRDGEKDRRKEGRNEPVKRKKDRDKG